MRLFFACPLPDQTLLDIQRWKETNLPPLPEPVGMSDYHITLAWLGEISPSRLEPLIHRADELLSPPERLTRAMLRSLPRPLSMTLDQYGCFPQKKTLWIGPSEWPEQLTYLNRKLTQIGLRMGMRANTAPFQPHVTLFRNFAGTAPSPLTPPAIRLAPEDIVLYEAIPGRNGPRHVSVAGWPIQHLM